MSAGAHADDVSATVATARPTVAAPTAEAVREPVEELAAIQSLGFAESITAAAPGALAPSGEPPRPDTVLESAPRRGAATMTAANAPVASIDVISGSALRAVAPLSRPTPMAPSPPTVSVALRAAAPEYWVQIGAFLDEARAARAIERLGAASFSISTGADALIRVRVGPFASRAAATTTARHLEGQGFRPFVVE